MVSTERRVAGDTAIRILDVAERLVQLRGFNAFSYADIAAELRVTTASLHYHYGSKATLGQALIERYTDRFMASLTDIEERLTDAPARLAAYVDLYASVLEHQRLCLCGMLAADYQTLPKAMRESVVRFFDHNEAWLSRILAVGQEQGSLHFAGTPIQTAQMIVCALEGAMLVARPYGDVGRFHAAASQLLSSLASGSGH